MYYRTGLFIKFLCHTGCSCAGTKVPGALQEDGPARHHQPQWRHACQAVFHRVVAAAAPVRQVHFPAALDVHDVSDSWLAAASSQEVSAGPRSFKAPFFTEGLAVGTLALCC